MKCKNCGHEEATDYMYCPNCGNKISNSKFRKKRIIRGSVLLLMIAGVLIWVNNVGVGGKKNVQDQVEYEDDEWEEEDEWEEIEEEESEEETNEKWYIDTEEGKAYLKLLNGDGKCDFSEEQKQAFETVEQYMITDLNDDGTSELLAKSSDVFFLFTYQEQKIKLVVSEDLVYEEGIWEVSEEYRVKIYVTISGEIGEYLSVQYPGMEKYVYNLRTFDGEKLTDEITLGYAYNSNTKENEYLINGSKSNKETFFEQKKLYVTDNEECNEWEQIE